MAEYTVEVTTSRTITETHRVTLDAEGRTTAIDQARAVVRRKMGTGIMVHEAKVVDPS